MIQTLSFNEMNLVQKIDWLSDMLGEAICAVAYVPYQEMTDSQKQQVKVRFFEFLNNENVDLFENVIEEVEKQFKTSPLASLLRYYGYRPTPTASPITEAAENLNSLKGEKVTIIKFSDFGFPIALNTTLHSAESKPYAQYNESLQIIHKPKKKRTHFRNTILPYQDVIIYKGWLNIDVEKLSYDTEENAHSIVKKSKYCSFDNQFLFDIVRTINADPIVKIVK
jgi:hypothetical protein